MRRRAAFPGVLVVVGAAAVILTAAVAFAEMGEGSSPSRPLTFRGVRLEVPSSWPVRRTPLHCNRYGPGTLITNLPDQVFRRDVDSIPPGACSTLWELQAVPRDFVLVDLSLMPVPSVGRKPPQDSQFPPTLAQAKYTSGTTKEVLCRCRYRYGFFWLQGRSYEVRVWIGTAASKSDRDAAETLLRSIRPRAS